MQVATAGGRMTPRLVDSLYVEAMVLADEVRAYFDEHGRSEREALPPMQRVSFSCESLKVTTRLMHVIAWLLTRRALEAGEITDDQARQPARRLGAAADSDPDVLAQLPETARALIESSRDLYMRIRRLDGGIDLPDRPTSPVRGLLHLLESAL